MFVKQTFYQVKHVPPGHLLRLFIQNINISSKLWRGLKHALFQSKRKFKGTVYLDKYKTPVAMFFFSRLYNVKLLLDFEPYMYPTNMHLLYELIVHMCISVCVYI